MGCVGWFLGPPCDEEEDEAVVTPTGPQEHGQQWMRLITIAKLKLEPANNPNILVPPKFNLFETCKSLKFDKCNDPRGVRKQRSGSKSSSVSVTRCTHEAHGLTRTVYTSVLKADQLGRDDLFSKDSGDGDPTPIMMFVVVFPEIELLNFSPEAHLQVATACRRPNPEEPFAICT
uniref:PITH domain-containing protein n=1 Tax=Panagrellus redivivus TaxID=6233 RepID=A0A7E4ZZ72_PANRE